MVYTFPLSDHVVMLDTATDVVHVGNEMGSDIWKLRNQGLSADAITDEIEKKYDVQREDAHADIEGFIRYLETRVNATSEPVPDYVPNTDFIADRPLNLVSQNSYYLPGFRINVVSEAPGLFEYLDPFFSLPDSLQSVENVLTLELYSDNGSYPVVFDGSTLDTGQSVADAALKCAREIGGMASRYFPWLIRIHAAAVARGDAGILIPAVGGSGKTTLSAYLMARGYRLLNDDVVPISAGSLQMLPVPISLSVKTGSWPLLIEDFPELGGLHEFGTGARQLKYLPPKGHQVQASPVDCSLIVLPQYSASTEGSNVQRVSCAEVFKEIIEGGCAIERPINPDDLRQFVGWLNEKPCFRLSYNRLDDAHKSIEELFQEIVG